MNGRLNETDIKKLLEMVKPLLDNLQIDYWLGRGVLKQVYLTGEVGNMQSDLDIHIWAEDRNKVKQKLGPILAKFNFNENNNEQYKLAYTDGKNHWVIEFVLLFQDGDIVYHTKRNGVHLECPKKCFDATNEKIEVAGVQINAPAFIEDYIKGIYNQS